MDNEQMNLLFQFSPIFVLGAIFYFMVWRPQAKERNERRKLLDSLKKDDKVYTIGGMCGTIVKLDDKMVVLKVADNVEVTFLRNAVSGLQETVK
ncbi:MAG: preprotein translocase subunit YajC [Phascolarctobacterium sp.]|nr:preprotein translocase subunit YajC [Candidatus Phascolarctobacterium caballi]MCQ2380923.1 preprotein translocase subunit YajC [Acidaminococcaceae bacterium]